MASINHDIHEIYVPCAQYDGYAVSNMGRVKNVRTDRVLNGSVLVNKKQNNRVQGIRVTLYDADGKHNVLAHRLVALAFLPNPNGFQFVDHKDRNTLNNKVSNLRWCSSRQNIMNVGKKANCTSEFIGVYWHERDGKYIARFQQNGKETWLGYYDCPETAARIRDVAIWFATPLADREYLELNFADYPFLHEDEEEDNVSINSDDTENSDPAHMDPIAHNAYGSSGEETDEDAVEVNHFDAEPPYTPPPFHDNRLENSDRELELTERSS